MQMRKKSYIQRALIYLSRISVNVTPATLDYHLCPVFQTSVPLSFIVYNYDIILTDKSG